MIGSPLNTFALAGRYLPRLGPALVVIELFAPTIAGDGLESTRDLVTNTTLAWSSVRMAVSSRTWDARGLTPADLSLARACEFDGARLVERG